MIKPFLILIIALSYSLKFILKLHTLFKPAHVIMMCFAYAKVIIIVISIVFTFIQSNIVNSKS